ncbi:fructose-6-phosphate aldolase [bacterium]|nr:fructose-6-phosphate aldolase [bacterium]
MKFFIDSADVAQIREAHDLGWADGVTTNPTLILKSGRELKEAITEICQIVDGPVFSEVVSSDVDGILGEGREMAAWGPNVVVKIPCTQAGLIAARILESEGIPTGITLIFSPSQALVAAKTGTRYLIPFVGRLDDISSFGMELIGQIREIVSNYPDFKAEVVAASLRNPLHILEAALMGVPIVTAPLSIYQQLLKHPLTDVGIQRFLQDWEKVKKS